MSDPVDTNFNVFVGGALGVLKGVYFGKEKPILKNFHDFEANAVERASRVSEIDCLSWAEEDGTQETLLIAHRNHAVKVYNRKIHAFTHGVKLELEKSRFVGIHSYNGNFLFGQENGKMIVWSFIEDKSLLEIPAGHHLSRVRQCPNQKSLFATGGNENDLKIWDVEATVPNSPIFKARNIPHDELDLRVPVWVEDLTFMPQSHDIVAVCSRYGGVRLYDSRAEDRRPVINMGFLDHPLMAISTTRNDRQVIVGSAQGKMGLVDLRNPGKGKVVRHYIGHAGGIRSISAHPNGAYFVSCGLDRHLYLHHLDERKSVKKLFLKSALNCILMTDDFALTDFKFRETSPTPTPVWQNIDMNVLNTGCNTLPNPLRKKAKISHD